MKYFRLAMLFPGSVLLVFALSRVARGQSTFTNSSHLFAISSDVSVQPSTTQPATFTEAPAAFDNKTNGFLSQADFETAKKFFEEREAISDGLGPVYNAQSCAECHQNPVTGAGSQVLELRAGHNGPNGYQDAPGGSLINSRAIDPAMQEYIPAGYEIRTFRTSLNTLGAGFVESIADSTLEQIANSQPPQMRGQIVMVPVMEAGGKLAVGRFGWKDQHASLLSFAGDAYLNEVGITSRLFPTENTSMGRSVAAYDTVADPEDLNGDIDQFAAFMRSTKAPSRDASLAATPDALTGAQLFQKIGCAVCHVPSIGTAAPGTTTDAGMFTVPEATGNKIIHPFSDFLLHDVGTGDGIIQNGGPSTQYKVRTAPLWGLRTRNQFMHDGMSLTLQEAIVRHGGEAAPVVFTFRFLPAVQKAQLIQFLKSL